jgi:hypothetical protein
MDKGSDGLLSILMQDPGQAHLKTLLTLPERYAKTVFN